MFIIIKFFNINFYVPTDRVFVPSPRQGKKTPEMKMNSKRKKRGGVNPKAKTDTVLGANPLRCRRSAGPFPQASPRFLKKKTENEKKSRGGRGHKR
jgi:hypothetical protein